MVVKTFYFHRPSKTQKGNIVLARSEDSANFLLTQAVNDDAGGESRNRVYCNVMAIECMK